MYKRLQESPFTEKKLFRCPMIRNLSCQGNPWWITETCSPAYDRENSMQSNVLRMFYDWNPGSPAPLSERWMLKLYNSPEQNCFQDNEIKLMCENLVASMPNRNYLRQNVIAPKGQHNNHQRLSPHLGLFEQIRTFLISSRLHWSSETINSTASKQTLKTASTICTQRESNARPLVHEPRVITTRA